MPFPADPMRFTNTVKKAGFWQTIETATLVLAQLLYIGVMARLLSKADFGLMAIASSFVVLGQIFSDGGMGPALIQRKTINQKHKNAALQSGVGLGLLVFSVFYFAAPYIASFYGNHEIKSIIRVIGINVILISIASISLGLLHREFMFKKSALVSIFSVIAGYTTGILAATNGMGVWSLVLATVIMSGIRAVGYFICAPIKFSLRIYKKEWGDLFSFGIGMIILKMINHLSGSGLNLVLGKIFTPSLLGVFERSNTIKTLPSVYLGNLLDKVLYPAMSKIQDDKDRLINIFENGLGVANSLLMPLTIYLILFAKEIVLIVLGEDWMGTVLPLQIMLVVLPFSISGRIGDTVIRATGHIYQNVYRKFVYVVFLVALTVTGATKFGIVGASIAVTVSFVLNYLMMIFLIRKIFGVKIWEVFYPPFLVGFGLTLFVGAVISLFRELANACGELNQVSFMVFSIILSSCLVLIYMKKPSLLGRYAVLLNQKLKGF